MSAGFRAVQWNRTKLIYDVILIITVWLYIGIFTAISVWIEPPKTVPDEIDVRIRAFGSAAFVMLTVILAIGPLARLNPRFLTLLYNRRHFGVLTFVVAALHAVFMLEWYAARGEMPSLLSELMTWADYGKFIGFPFKALGIAALLLLLLLAVTSHDFWLSFLGPPAWKWLHMSLYVAYGLVVMHVALGIMQYDHNPLLPLMLATSLGTLVLLHVLAGWRGREQDQEAAAPDRWITVGSPHAIPDKGAVIVSAP